MPDKTKPFCGIGNIPKGYHRGSMIDCLNNGQVRYWGLKKVDPRALKHVTETPKADRRPRKKVSDMTTRELRTEVIICKGKMRKLKMDYRDEDDEKKKKMIKQEAEKIIKKMEFLVEKFKEAEKREKKEEKEKEKEEKKKKEAKKKKETKTKKSKKSKK